MKEGKGAWQYSQSNSINCIILQIIFILLMYLLDHHIYLLFPIFMLQCTKIPRKSGFAFNFLLDKRHKSFLRTAGRHMIRSVKLRSSTTTTTMARRSFYNPDRHARLQIDYYRNVPCRQCMHIPRHIHCRSTRPMPRNTRPFSEGNISPYVTRDLMRRAFACAP